MTPGANDVPRVTGESTSAEHRVASSSAVSRNVRRVLLVCLAGLLLYGSAAIWFDLNPVQYHRFGLMLAVPEPKERFTFRYLLWNLQGRRSSHAIQEERSIHNNRLIELGYFVPEEFNLQHVVLDQYRGRGLLDTLINIKTRWYYEGRLPQDMGWIQPISTTALVIYAPKEMLPAWRGIVKEFDVPGQMPTIIP